MSDAASPTPVAAKKLAKEKKAVVKPVHPAFGEMIISAVKELKERTGSSRQAILKYILTHYKVTDEKKSASRLNSALKKGVTSGVLKQVKGTGATGSFKVGKEEVEPKKKAFKEEVKPKKKVVKEGVKPKKAGARKPQVTKNSESEGGSKKPKSTKTVKRKTVDNIKKTNVKKTVAKSSSKKTTAKKPIAKKTNKTTTAKKVLKKNTATK